MEPRTVTLDELAGACGQRIATSGWLVVTQAMIDTFAAATHDDQWIHVDVERARRESPFAGTVAHGMLTLSLLPQLCRAAVRIAGAQALVDEGFDRVRFVSPVPAGAQIRSVLDLEEVERRPGGAHVAWRVTVEVHGVARPAVSALWRSQVVLAVAPPR
jgi:acyl dehydratase